MIRGAPGDDQEFDSGVEMGRMQLELIRIADIARSINMLVCEVCLNFVMAPARHGSHTSSPKHVLCPDCSGLDKGLRKTDHFDDLTNTVHMALHLLVSATRRLTESDNACWVTLRTLVYTMGPLLRENPEFGCMPMGDTVQLEAECGSVDVMTFDRDAINAKGSGPVHIMCIESLLRLMQRTVTKIVRTGNFAKVQPVLSLLMAWIRIITADANNPGVSTEEERLDLQNTFAKGGYNSHVNRCFDLGSTKKKKRLANKWILGYVTAFIGVVLRATHEWANGKHDIAEIYAIMAVNTQVPGTKNGKGAKVTLDWQARGLGTELTKALAEMYDHSENEIVTIQKFDNIEAAFNLDRKGNSHQHDLAYVCPALRLMVLQKLLYLVSPSKMSKEAYLWLKLATDPEQPDAKLLNENGSAFIVDEDNPDLRPTTGQILPIANTSQIEDAGFENGFTSHILDTTNAQVNEFAVITGLPKVRKRVRDADGNVENGFTSHILDTNNAQVNEFAVITGLTNPSDTHQSPKRPCPRDDSIELQMIDYFQPTH